MKRHLSWIFPAFLTLLVACSGQKHEPTVPESSASIDPVYGGELNVGTVYVSLSALSWDPADWAWKSNHDSGLVREQLLAADLDKSVRKGGAYRFIADAYIPDDALRGELAEDWFFEDPLTLVFQLRKGVMFHAVPGVMDAREITAEDVVFSFETINQSPKRINLYFDHIDSVEARDKYTVVFRFNTFNAEWPYRFGYGYYSGIVPRELADADAKKWQNLTGTGPYRLTRYIQGNLHQYDRIDDYWDTEEVNGQAYRVPFVDRINYRIIKDEATYLSALRTARLDILESIRWEVVDHLKGTTPELKWNRWLSTNGTFVALRVDEKPFDDIRVRRAMNLAINQHEILEIFYGGHGQIMAYPQHPEFGNYFQPLSEMPPSVQSLFEYDPDEARRLLAQAGYPNGFETTMQLCACSQAHMDLAPLIVSYLKEVGVRVKLETYEYASFLSLMMSKQNGPAYLMSSGVSAPLTSLRKNFATGQTWNASGYSNPEFDRRLKFAFETRDENERVKVIQELSSEILDEAPYIWLPTEYVYTAWWPWVRNYEGELRAGAVRPGPIYARIWIDEQMKREMGFSRGRQ